MFVADMTNGVRPLESLVAAVPPGAVVLTEGWPVAVSPDGATLAMTSGQAGLASGVDGSDREFYLRDLATGRMTLVSTDEFGGPAGGAEFVTAQFSPDGKRLYFDGAGALVAGDSNDSSDVYVRDLATGENRLLSTAAVVPQAVAANGSSTVNPGGISTDARWVLFTSYATDLVAGRVPTDATLQLFLRDTVAGTNLMVSALPDGGMPRVGGVVSASMSADGQRVAFSTTSPGLTSDDADTREDVFLFVGPGTPLKRLSSSATGFPNRNRAGSVAMSRDGDSVAFEVQHDAGLADVLLYRVSTDTTVVLSTNVVSSDPFVSSLSLKGSSRAPQIAADGAVVAFAANPGPFVVVRDTRTGQTFRPESSGKNPVFALSADGRRLAYVRTRSIPSGQDIVVYDIPSRTTNRVVQIHPFEVPELSLSADGSRLAFVSHLAYVAGDTNSVNDVYVLGVADGTITLASANPGGFSGNARSDQPCLAGDGSRVVFRSCATDLAPGGSRGVGDVFARDLASGTTTLLSRGPTGAAGTDVSAQPSLSADGRVAMFRSYAANLVPGDTNASQDVFLAVLDASDAPRLDATIPSMDGPIRLVWLGVIGIFYRVESAGTLSGPWTAVGDEIAGTGGMATVDDGPAVASARYYRLVTRR